MQSHEKELILYRILVGYLKCEIKDKTGKSYKLRIYSPTISQMLNAQEIYNETYDECIDEGIFDETQYLYHIQGRGLWTIEDEKKLTDLPKEMEDIKISMYENLLKSITRENLRKILNQKKIEHSNLFARKYRLNYLTAEGLAGMAKTYYLAGQCTVEEGKCPQSAPILFPPLLDYDAPNTILEELIEFKNHNRLEESTYREIVRTEPWRTYWSCGDVFGKPTLELTEEQRNLVSTARLFDNIMECPECPAAWVLEDDDLLDGWMLCQRRKREEQDLRIEGESLISPQMAKADMVFIPIETEEDNKRVEALNSPMAKMIKKQRMNLLQDRKTVKEEEFSDQRLKVMRAMAQNQTQ